MELFWKFWVVFECCTRSFVLWFVIGCISFSFSCFFLLVMGLLLLAWTGWNGGGNLKANKPLLKHMAQNWSAIVESALMLENKGRNVATVWPRLVLGNASLGFIHKHDWNFWSCIYQDYYCYLCWNDLVDFYNCGLFLCVSAYLSACSCILLMLSFRMSSNKIKCFFLCQMPSDIQLQQEPRVCMECTQNYAQ